MKMKFLKITVITILFMILCSISANIFAEEYDLRKGELGWRASMNKPGFRGPFAWIYSPEEIKNVYFCYDHDLPLTQGITELPYDPNWFKGSYTAYTSGSYESGLAAHYVYEGHLMGAARIMAEDYVKNIVGTYKYVRTIISDDINNEYNNPTEKERFFYAFWGQYVDADKEYPIEDWMNNVIKRSNNKFTYGDLQGAIWYAQCKDGEESPFEGNWQLVNVGKEYETFYDKSVKDNKKINAYFENEVEPEIEDAVKPKVNIKNDYYMVGPFKAHYDTIKMTVNQELPKEEIADNNILFSWIESINIRSDILDKNINITDKNENSKFQITDEEGNPLYTLKMTTDNKGITSEINAPQSDEEFYVRFPYSENEFLKAGKESDMTVTLNFKYIAGPATGENNTIKTSYKLAKTTTHNVYVFQVGGITSGASTTYNAPGGKESNEAAIGQSTEIEYPNGGSDNDDSDPNPDNPTTPTPTGTPGPGDGEGWNYTVNAWATVAWDYEAEVEEEDNRQDLVYDIRGQLVFEDTSITTTFKSEKTEGEMIIEGSVWNDNRSGKDQKVDGKLDNNVDTLLNGIEVWLYEVVDTQAESDLELDGIYLKVVDNLGDSIEGNTNPQLTRNLVNTATGEAENGRYSFKNVKAYGHKYIVVFKYDGMLFTNTYGAGLATYNSDEWKATSKGTELLSERDLLNNRFKTIESVSSSYKVSRRIFNDDNYLTEKDNNYYNKIYNAKGKEVVEYRRLIGEKLKNCTFVRTDNDYINQIYNSILNDVQASDRVEAMRILQFIWDCRMNSYAGYMSVEEGATKLQITTDANSVYDAYYPWFTKFELLTPEGTLPRGQAGWDVVDENGYGYIYDGQLYVNLGLIERNDTELSLTEDLDSVIVSINGKDQKYKYNALSEDRSLTLLTSDVLQQYNQVIAPEDYNYATTSSTLDSNVAKYTENYAPIQVYATYKIIIKNISGSKTSINEVVKYFDKHYFSYSNGYTTTEGATIEGVWAAKNTNNKENAIGGVRVNTDSSCKGSDVLINNTETTSMIDQTDLYITFDEKTILENNEKIFINITLRLGENSDIAKYSCSYNNGGNSANNILQKELGSGNKINAKTYTEINSYSTYKYSNDDNQDVQTRYTGRYNTTINNGAYRAGGFLDKYSIPGNLDTVQIDLRSKNQELNNSWLIKTNVYDTGYIQSIEYDWDSAPILILMNPESSSHRTITGNVWETVEEASEFNVRGTKKDEYPQYNASLKVKDIEVELIEIKNGKGEIRATTLTDVNGNYFFTDFIPGDYIVRFRYGSRAEYDSTQYSENRTYTLPVVENGEVIEKEFKYAYNGQFYQSAKANPNTNAEQYWYAFETDTRYSDASDDANIRMHVNDMLKEYAYGDVIHATKHAQYYTVYANTSLLNVEVEYAKKESSSSNPAYTIRNIDFGLTPRTESKLEINKEVDRVKLVLQDGSVQFDATPEEITEQKVAGVTQVMRGSNINIQIANQLISGATIEITYKITVTNNGKYDSTRYYKDASGNIIAIGLYEEDPTKIVYYEDGKIRKYSDNITELVDYSANRTETIETTVKPVEVIDFISNNLSFSKTSYTGEEINKDWDVITDKEQMEAYYKIFEEDKNLNPNSIKDLNKEELYDYNYIVKANSQNPLINKDLKSGEKLSTQIVLSQVISTDSVLNGDTTFNNRVKILKINNSVSRIQEVPIEYESEKVVIGDPTGTTINYTAIILTLVVATTIGIGVILIKKFALNKN